MTNRHTTIKVTTEKRVYQPFTPEEEKKRTILRIVHITLAVVLIVVAALLVHSEIINLYPGSVTADSLANFASKVEFAAKYQLLLVCWLVFNVFATIHGRITTKALNPLIDITESRILSHKNILTNSFEQIFISIASQLIFVSFAEATTVLKFIPFINIVQLIGRIAFFAGYPMQRGFGFSCTMFPNVAMALFNLFQFGKFLGLY